MECKVEPFNLKVGVMLLKGFFTDKTENLKVKVEPFNFRYHPHTQP